MAKAIGGFFLGVFIGIWVIIETAAPEFDDLAQQLALERSMNEALLAMNNWCGRQLAGGVDD